MPPRQRQDGTLVGMTEQQSSEPGSAHSPHIVVVGQDGQPLGQIESNPDADEREITDLVEQPAKVMRIGSMIKQLLDEVRNSPLDDAARERLREVHTRSIRELEDGLAPELVDELERLSLPFGSTTPTDAELRIAQAQLVGWLEGLFHGIQTALFAQQMAARAQFEEMRRRAIGPGIPGDGSDASESVGPNPARRPPSGPYL